MSFQASEIVARFWVHMRCQNCHHVIGREVEVPDVDDAPRHASELLDGELLRRLSFRCFKCENPIGSAVSVKSLKLRKIR